MASLALRWSSDGGTLGASERGLSLLYQDACPVLVLGSVLCAARRNIAAGS